MATEDVCADCSSPEPEWASINRGILICDECCSVHRSLGRQISYVRSLRANNWPPVLREMVSLLVKKGANTIWEHALHDPQSKVKIKKPSPKDKLHPTKHDFIIAKHKHLVLLSKASSKDNPNLVQELSKQLHASVRTNNLDTCLRILSLGADPNFLHPDRGNTPLHVAAQAGQAMQVELLVVYGANPAALDRLGHTPEECARIAGYHQLADRLIECQYELTDKLSFFLCGRKPVHSIGEHYLVPKESPTGSLGLTEARSRLRELSNQLLEELAADIYDEVDRRESDAIWLTTQQLSSVAFLPVNPMLSHLRNQGRQKLATLDTQEFSQLLIDILTDTKRRQASSLSSSDKSGTIVPTSSGEQDDQHDYDEVPVENETSRYKVDHQYSTVSEAKPVDNYAEPKEEEPTGPNSVFIPASSSPKGTPSGLQTPVTLTSPPIAPGSIQDTQLDTSQTVERLKRVEAERDELTAANRLLEQKVITLQKQLNRMIEENAHLRISLSSTPPPECAVTPTPPTPPPTVQRPAEEVDRMYSVVDKSRTMSLKLRTQGSNSAGAPKIDTGKKSFNKEATGDGEPLTLSTESAEEGKKKPTLAKESEETEKPLEEGRKTPNINASNGEGKSKSSVDYDALSVDDSKQKQLDEDKRKPPSLPTEEVKTRLDGGSAEKKLIRASDEGTSHQESAESTDTAQRDASMPTLEEVDAHIKVITQNIQELLQAAQSQKQNSFGPCSTKVARSITQLTKAFPKCICSQVVQASLRELGLAAQQLQKACQDQSQTDLAYQTRLIMGCAYDVAKAARHLVMCVQQEQ